MTIHSLAEKLDQSKDPKSPRVLLAAGASGGHIMPAVALAEALTELAPHVQLQFVSGNRSTELQIYRRLKIEPWVLPVPHNRPGFSQRVKFLGQMSAAWRQSRQLLKAHPVKVAVGFGGYISAPPMLAARLAGARLALFEPNVHPGAANRLLAPFAKLVACAEETKWDVFPHAHTRPIGNLVRQSFLHPVAKADARSFFRLRPDRMVLLCTGGSQGAAKVNRILLDLARRINELESPASRWQLLWSTGHAHYQQVMQGLKDLGINPADHSINPFIEEQSTALSASDAVLTRAGALTLAELTVVGRPAIIMPLAGGYGHQLYNARRMQEAGMAEMLDENDPQAGDKLEALLGAWAEYPETLEKMSAAARVLGRPHAARQMAELVLELL